MSEYTVGLHRAARPRDAVVAGLLHGLSAAMTVLVVLVAVVLLERRVAGALENALPPASLALTGLVLAAAAAATRLARPRATPASPHAGLAAEVLTTAAVLTAGAGLALPGTHPAALAVLWTVLAGERCWAWRQTLRDIRRRSVQAAEPADAGLPGGGSPAGPGPAVADASEADHDADELPEDPQALGPPDDVLQQLTLRRDEAGRQRLFGWLRMPLAAGQRSGNLHVAFCPPFAAVPEIEVEPFLGPACRIKAAQVLPYGVRLEVKLDAPAEEAGWVLLRFAAEAEGTPGRPSEPL